MVIMDKKRLLIFEPQPDGHRFDFARYAAESFVRNGWHVTLCSHESSFDHPNGKRLLAEFGERLQPMAIRWPWSARQLRSWGPGFRRDQLALALALRSAVRNADPAFDHVFLPTLENIGVFFAALLRPFVRTPWSAVAHSLHFHLPEILGRARKSSDATQEIAFRHILRDRALVGLLTVDPYLEKAIADPRVRYAADPVKPPQQANRQDGRRHFGIDTDALVVLVYGVIDFRKRVDQLFAAVASTTLRRQIVVLLAGVQRGQDVEGLMRGAEVGKLSGNGQIVIANRFIDDREEGLAFAACDVAWVYTVREFAISNVMGKAIAAGRPVVGRSGTLVGRMISDFGIGLCGSEPNSLSAAIAEIAALPRDHFDSALSEARKSLGSPELFGRAIWTTASA